ncbi:MAG TPA: hypothetical protein VGQ83_19705 [Polyangia bacterium]|jgi:hypothetical protein
MVKYDRYLDYQLGRNSPRQVFVDADGVAIFGTLQFLRASLDGTLVRKVPYPTDPANGVVFPPFAVAQAAGAYGLVFASYSAWSGATFCVFRGDAPIDLSTCAKIPTPWGSAIPTWDGSAYRVYARLDDHTMFLSRYDPNGAFVDQVTFPTIDPNPGGWPLFVGPNAFIFAATWRPNKCTSDFLYVMPRSLDTTALRIFDLLPPDAIDVAIPQLASSGRRAAFIYGAVCATPYPEGGCAAGYPSYVTGTYVTVTQDDGTPLPRRQVFGAPQPVIWDGARFVHLNGLPLGGHGGMGVNVFDENNVALVENARLPLAWEQGHSADEAGTRIAAVGVNDYIVAYALVDNGETRIARFSLPTP